MTILKEAMMKLFTAMAPPALRGEALALADFGGGREAMGMEEVNLVVGTRISGIRVVDLAVAVIKVVGMGNSAENLEALARCAHGKS